MVCPLCTLAGPVFVIDKSAVAANATTVSVEDWPLLAGLRSGVMLEASATLVMFVRGGTAAPTLATSVKLAEPPGARLAIVAVTVPLAPTAGVVGVHPAGAEKLTKVKPAGNASFSDTLTAVCGPALFTVMV